MHTRHQSESTAWIRESALVCTNGQHGTNADESQRLHKWGRLAPLTYDLLFGFPTFWKSWWRSLQMAIMWFPDTWQLVLRVNGLTSTKIVIMWPQEYLTARTPRTPCNHHSFSMAVTWNNHWANDQRSRTTCISHIRNFGTVNLTFNTFLGWLFFNHFI